MKHQTTFTSQLAGLLPLPTFSFETFIHFFTSSPSIPSRRSRPSFKISSFKNIFTPPVKIALAVVLGLLIIAFFGRNLFSTTKPSTAANAEDKASVTPPKATLSLNREFSFPLLDDKNEEVSQFKFVLEEAQLRDEIIVQGQKAHTIEGRTFLIINLKIDNQFTQPIELDSRDYLRLSVNGNQDEWLAPEIHNDPVEVQAISIKNTRLGFPINDSDTSLVLQVGEIQGDKEKIEINFN